MNGLRDEIRCGSLHHRSTSRHHSRWPGRPRNAYCVARSRATGSIADNLPTAKADATDTSPLALSDTARWLKDGGFRDLKQKLPSSVLVYEFTP